jgi:spore coat protein U-like protein
MKSLKLKVAVAAFAAISGSAAIADTMDMTVRARVNGACRMVTAPLVNFGILNQVTAPDLTLPSVNVQYRCTKDLVPGTFTIGSSATGTYTGAVGNGTDTIPYTLTWSPAAVTAGLGMAVGQEVSVGVVGAMTGTDYQNVSAGVYSQTVTIEVLP